MVPPYKLSELSEHSHIMPPLHGGPELNSTQTGRFCTWIHDSGHEKITHFTNGGLIK
jgi:hypothetical protein